jgi:uncharacterized FlgJ-related protein
MKSIINRILIFTIVLMSAYACTAQTTASNISAANTKTSAMKTYLIERDIPGAGNLTPAQLKTISQKSNSVLKDMGPDIQWIQSYVTGDKIFCVYKAENEDLIREHAKKGGFPANKITEVETEISPATATAEVN